MVTGQTSSISSEIIGFDGMGTLVNIRHHSTEEICSKSTKLLTLTDLCGHERYLRTTISGLVGHKPDFVMLVISSVQQSNSDFTTCSQQLALARAVSVPIFLVLTKTDLLHQQKLKLKQPLGDSVASVSGGDNDAVVFVADETEQVAESAAERHSHAVHQCVRALSDSGVGGRRVLSIVESESDAVNAARNIQSESILPVFNVSSKTGKNMHLLLKFLNMLPSDRTQREKDRLQLMPTVFSVVQFYRMPQIVLAGYVEAGIIQLNDTLLLGPDCRGQFKSVVVKSIHRYKNACRIAKAGEAASIAIEACDADCVSLLRKKGLFLVHRDQFIAAADENNNMLSGRCRTAFRAQVQLYRSSSASATTTTNRMVSAATVPSMLSSSADNNNERISNTFNTICLGAHLSLHIGNIVQTAVVTRIDDDIDADTELNESAGGATESPHGNTLRKAHSWAESSAQTLLSAETEGNLPVFDVDPVEMTITINDVNLCRSPNAVAANTARRKTESGSGKAHSDSENHVIEFSFLQRPEFVILNSKIILRQNRQTLGVGKVVGFVNTIAPLIDMNVPCSDAVFNQSPPTPTTPTPLITDPTNDDGDNARLFRYSNGAATATPAAFINVDLIGFDSHSPLTQLDYLDDDD